MDVYRVVQLRTEWLQGGYEGESVINGRHEDLYERSSRGALQAVHCILSLLRAWARLHCDQGRKWRVAREARRRRAAWLHELESVISLVNRILDPTFPAACFGLCH